MDDSDEGFDAHTSWEERSARKRLRLFQARQQRKELDKAWYAARKQARVEFLASLLLASETKRTADGD
jgi:hypothetical protein